MNIQSNVTRHAVDSSARLEHESLLVSLVELLDLAPLADGERPDLETARERRYRRISELPPHVRPEPL